jgi:Ca2+-binding RTX toxin-like protein
MVKKTISEDTNQVWNIQGDNETWTLEKDASIVLAENYAIKVGYNDTGNTLKLFGDVLNAGPGNEGIGIFGDKTTTIIGPDSEISGGGDGIYMASADSRIINKGRIEGATSGIISEQTAVIRNSGDIVGQFAINVAGSGMRIVNDEGATIEGSVFGITVLGHGGAKIVNHGTISGANSAIIIDGDGDNSIINRGTIEGDVIVAAGHDLIDTRAGVVTGSISGGEGNDRYKVSDSNQVIIENASEGHDVIYSSVDFVLPDNVEQLVMIGNVGSNAVGNNSHNYITGNKAQNTISGGMGDDDICGAAGDDFLSGDAGADTFVLRRGDDQDTVADFENGVDTIRLTGFDGVEDFSALQSHVSQHGADVWISLGRGDRLVLVDTVVAELDETDFAF